MDVCIATRSFTAVSCKNDSKVGWLFFSLLMIIFYTIQPLMDKF